MWGAEPPDLRDFPLVALDPLRSEVLAPRALNCRSTTLTPQEASAERNTRTTPGLFACDVYSGWVELRALRNRVHRWVAEQAENIRVQLPFELKGWDSGNAGEFINHPLYRWAQDHQITFTRTRSYRKNDNCFVEQKNDLTVRRHCGLLPL